MGLCDDKIRGEVLLLIKNRYNVLYGDVTPSNSQSDKNKAWDEVLAGAQALGAKFADRKQFQNNVKNWKQALNKKKSENVSGAGTQPLLTENEKILNDIFYGKCPDGTANNKIADSGGLSTLKSKPPVRYSCSSASTTSVTSLRNLLETQQEGSGNPSNHFQVDCDDIDVAVPSTSGSSEPRDEPRETKNLNGHGKYSFYLVLYRVSHLSR